MIHMDGVWWFLCADTVDDSIANVSCKHFSFVGGVAYQPNEYLYDHKILLQV